MSEELTGLEDEQSPEEEPEIDAGDAEDEAPEEESAEEESAPESTHIVALPAPTPADPDDEVVRKETSHPAEASLVRGKEQRISRTLLGEIEQRRGVDDLHTLIAACEHLLDEVEELEGRL